MLKIRLKYLSILKFINPEINKLKAWTVPSDGIEIKSNILESDYFDFDKNKISIRSESVLDIVITIERNFQHYLLKIIWKCLKQIKLKILKTIQIIDLHLMKKKITS